MKLTKLTQIINLNSKDINEILMIWFHDVKAIPKSFSIEYLRQNNQNYVLCVDVNNTKLFSSVEIASVDKSEKDFKCDDKLSFTTNIDGTSYLILFILDILINKMTSNVISRLYRPKFNPLVHNILEYKLDKYSVFNRVLGKYIVDLTPYKSDVKNHIMKHMSMSVTVIDSIKIDYPNYKLVSSQGDQYSFEYQLS
jgi:hypothetical protein